MCFSNWLCLPQLFTKRYYKTKHGTFVPTLREFWKPRATQRTASPGNRRRWKNNLLESEQKHLSGLEWILNIFNSSTFKNSPCSFYKCFKLDLIWICGCNHKIPDYKLHVAVFLCFYSEILLFHVCFLK